MLLLWSKVHKLCSTLSIILLISLFEKQSKWKGPFGLSYAQLSSVAFLLIFCYAPNLCVVTQCSSPEVCGITKNSCKGDYPSVGHLIVHLWHDTEFVCYSQKFSEKSWRLESKWNTIFWVVGWNVIHVHVRLYPLNHGGVGERDPTGYGVKMCDISNYVGLSPGKFPGAMEHLKSFSCFSGRKVLNGSSCCISSEPSVVPVSGFRSHFLVNGTDLYKW